MPGPLVDKAAETLARLSHRLLGYHASSSADLSLASGLAGMALAHAHLGLVFPGRPHHDRAIELLERAVELAHSSLPGSLFEGPLGVAFVLEHLCNLGLLEEGDASTEELCESILMDPSRRAGVLQHAELVRGAAGVLTYATECRGRHHSEELAYQAVERLRSSASVVGSNTLWTVENGVIDVGVAHGHSGIMGALARTHTFFPGLGVLPMVTNSLHELSTMRAVEGRHYPSFLRMDRSLSWDARHAWCYGTPGTTAMALMAGQRIGEPRAGDEVMAIRCADLTRDTARLDGPGLCHGTASLAHLFRRLSGLVSDGRILTAANGWFGALLDELEQSEPLDMSLLDGVSGIALVIAGALDPAADDWDAPFLLDFTGNPLPTLCHPHEKKRQAEEPTIGLPAGRLLCPPDAPAPRLGAW